MRYHLESTLPIHAFNPLGGRHSPFKHGMTLEGGGGGIIESVGYKIGKSCHNYLALRFASNK